MDPSTRKTVDEYISQLMECKSLTETQVQDLCEKVCPCVVFTGFFYALCAIVTCVLYANNSIDHSFGCISLHRCVFSPHLLFCFFVFVFPDAGRMCAYDGDGL